jgi:cysteine synthase
VESKEEIVGYYYDNWKKASLPVIPITDNRVNPFSRFGLKMVAIAGNTLPLGSVKVLAAVSMWEGLKDAGMVSRKMVESSSGEFGKEFVFLAEEFGASIGDITIVMKGDVPPTKSMWPAAYGAQTIKLTTAQTPIQYCREIGGGGWIEGRGWHPTNKTINPDQYAWPGIKGYYRDWAVPKMLESTGGIDWLVSPVGTGGTLIGFEEGLREHSDRDTEVIAAVCAPGHEIPGMRTAASSSPPEVLQPWRAAVKEIVPVERKPAFLCAPWVSRAIRIPTGPSGGGTYVAACRFIQQLIDKGEGERLHDRTLAFIVHDNVAAYVGDRYPEFDPDDLYINKAPWPKQLIFG